MMIKEIYKNYEIYILEKNCEIYELEKNKISNKNLTYYEGYIVIPKNSKFYNKSCDFINLKIRVYRGFTFADFIKENYVIGFNTINYFDNKNTQNIEFVLEELKKAVNQLIEKEKDDNEKNKL